MSFSKQKHVKFWRMNASLLPNHYLSNDSSRMTLGFFIVAALDLLDALDTVSLTERQAWIEWIYSCQCPEGGFRGFTGTNLNDHRNHDNRVWDPANVPATFFALATLLVLGDDMKRVLRNECLQWLPQIQRFDGSFGEVLGKHGNIEGGRDLRFCCCAAGIAFMLDGADRNGFKSIDWTNLAAYIQSCQNYNGGFGESPSKEPHSGLTYCAIAALAFAKKTGSAMQRDTEDKIQASHELLRWILDRQTQVLEEEEDDVSEDEDDGYEENQPSAASDRNGDAITDVQQSAAPAEIAGFNGREGKIADTCYCFWNTGALAILGHDNLIEADAMQRYLLEKVQHMIGGFGKGIGAPPDVMHSYLGLAALSVIKVDGIKPIDPSLCISRQAAARLNHLSWE